MNSNLLSLCKALRVACEYLPGSRQFVVSKVFPWILTFYDNGYVYHNMSFVYTAVPSEERKIEAVLCGYDNLFHWVSPYKNEP